MSTYRDLSALVSRLRDDLNQREVTATKKVTHKPATILLVYAYNRALNLLSHGRYAIYEPTPMGDDNKDLFRRILGDFITKFQFALPEIVETPAAPVPTAPPSAAAAQT